MLITRSYKRKCKNQERKEKILMMLAGGIALLIVLLFIFAPVVATFYSFSIGFTFNFKNVFSLIFLYIYSWGSLYILYDHIFG